MPSRACDEWCLIDCTMRAAVCCECSHRRLCLLRLRWLAQRSHCCLLTHWSDQLVLCCRPYQSSVYCIISIFNSLIHTTRVEERPRTTTCSCSAIHSSASTQQPQYGTQAHRKANTYRTGHARDDTITGGRHAECTPHTPHNTTRDNTSQHDTTAASSDQSTNQSGSSGSGG